MISRHIVVAGMLLSVATATVVEASSLKNWYKSEVQYLLEKKEVKKYKKIKKDSERQKYIDDFWKSLDPTPETAENEAQEIFAKRVKMAEKNFGKDGWKTHTGRVLLILGPPSDSKMEQGDMAGGTARHTTMSWTYPDGTTGVPDGQAVVFSGILPKLSLKTKEIDLSKKSFIASLKVKKPSPAKPTPPPVAAQAPQSPQDPTVQEIIQAITEKKFSAAIGLEIEPYFIPSPDGNIFMPMAIQVDFSGAPAPQGAEKRACHIFGAFYQGDKMVKNFVLSHEVGAEPSKVLVFKSEVLAPGSYNVLIGARDDSSGVYGLKEFKVDTPDFHGLGTTTILLAKSIDQQTAPRSDLLTVLTDAIYLGPMKMMPYFGRKLQKEDPINVFYALVGASQDPVTSQLKVKVTYELTQNGKSIKKFALPEITGPIVMHPMSFKEYSVKKGPCELKLKIEDLVGGTTLNKTLELEIE